MIPVIQARPLYTNAYVALLKQRVAPQSFLRSFFRVEERRTKYLSIAVRRGTELVAVDVERGASGNRNSVSRSTEKTFKPPYFNEWFDATELSVYDTAMGATVVDAPMLAEFAREIAEEAMLLQDKIERAIEKQCAEVFETGIVKLKKGININFGRKAESLKDNSANPWTNNAVDPNAQLEEGAKFLKETGKMQGNVINVLCGGSTWSDYLGNEKVQKRNDVRRYDLSTINMPQRNSVGATYVGEVAAGSYVFKFWTYPEGYETLVNGVRVRTPFLNEKKVVLIPENAEFVLGYALVPQLIRPGVPVQSGAFVISEHMDEENQVHKFKVRSAPVAIPVEVDKIYTMTVKA